MRRRKREETHKKQLGYSLPLAHTYVTCCGGNTNHKTTRDIKMYIEIQISKLRAAEKSVQELLKSCRPANVCPLSGLITGRKGKNYLSYTHSLHYPTCIKKWLNEEQWYKRERERERERTAQKGGNLEKEMKLITGKQNLKCTRISIGRG